jgi:hypothetical protein
MLYFINNIKNIHIQVTSSFRNRIVDIVMTQLKKTTTQICLEYRNKSIDYNIMQ